MEIEGKSFLYGALIIILLLLATVSMGIIKFNSGNSVQGESSSSGMPEKCKVPAGQDVSSWKEHLGHHAETQDCLKYYK